MMIKPARGFSVMFDWARRYPGKAAAVLSLSWLAALMVQGDAEKNLLSALGDNRDWIQDDWILRQLHRHWSDRIAAGLNEIRRARGEIPSALRVQITALLSVKGAVEQTKVDSLRLSYARENRWLASLVSNSKAVDARLVVSER